jgi:sugar/nucleoside kinase (ribokinase family)
MSHKPEPTPFIVAIETAVVDYNYPAISEHEELKHAFISALPRLIQETGHAEDTPITEAPRKGDMIMISAETLDDVLVHFANSASNFPEEYFPIHTSSQRENADRARKILFGTPTPHAGGSLANSFDAMIYSKVNGEALYDGVFVTAVGDDEAGDYFEKSFEGHIVATKGGRGMVSHIIPVDGDRIMLTAPSFANPADKHFDLQSQLSPELLEKANIIMIGGYLFFAGQLDNAIKITDENAHSGNSKTRIITLASQLIAQNNPLKETFYNKLYLFDRTVIHANTGEFRRNLGMDDDWRKRFDSDFVDSEGNPLQGREAEEAKNHHLDYQNAKQAANMAASIEAESLADEDYGYLSFVVTNGSAPARAINETGILLRSGDKVGKEKIQSTVGAGDNHVAGYWVGKALSMNESGCLDMANAFARSVIQIPEARLPRDAKFESPSGDIFEGPIAVVARENTSFDLA